MVLITLNNWIEKMKMFTFTLVEKGAFVPVGKGLLSRFFQPGQSKRDKRGSLLSRAPYRPGQKGYDMAGAGRAGVTPFCPGW